MKSITRTITILAFLIAFLIPFSPAKAEGMLCTWIVNDGTWDNKENWDCGKLPEPDDEVSILAGQVTLTGDVQIKSLSLSGYGKLIGTGDVIADTINWSGGTMSGSGSITALKEANFTGNNYLILSGRNFINVGTATLNWPGGTGFLYLYTAETEFHNLAGATFTIQSSNTLSVMGGDGTFVNEGSFILDLDNPETNVAIGSNFVNTSPGVVEVASGTLKINSTGATNSTGGYNVHAGATLSLGGWVRSLTGDIACSGEGTLEFVTGVTLDGTLTFPYGILSLPGNGLLTLSTADSSANVGTLNLSGGRVIGPGDLTANTINWSNGVMNGGGTTTATTALNLTGSAILTLYNRTLNNAGAATWNRTGYMDMQGTAMLNNQAGATFTIQNAALSFIFGGTFNNAGTLTKSGPVTDVQISAPFVNTGVVEVESGKLLTNNSSAAVPASSGDYHIHPGATLRLGGNVYTMTGDIAVTGEGTIETTADINLDGKLTFPDGALSLISGGLLNLSTEATTANIGTLNLSLGGVTGPGDVTAGTINWSAGTMSGSGSTTASTALTFTGTGTITLTDRTLNNAGAATWNKTGAGTLNLQTETSVFNNQAGATFTAQSSGQTVIFVGLGAFNNAGTLNLTTGEYRIHKFTQSSGGKTNLAIGGVTRYTNYSSFSTTHAELAGELNVTFTGGYTPKVNDRYVLLTYSSDRTGDFSPVHIAPVGDLIWVRYYQGKALNVWAAKYQVMIPMMKK